MLHPRNQVAWEAQGEAMLAEMAMRPVPDPARLKRAGAAEVEAAYSHLQAHSLVVAARSYVEPPLYLFAHLL